LLKTFIFNVYDPALETTHSANRMCSYKFNLAAQSNITNEALE